MQPVKTFLLHYAADHAMILPGRYPGFKDADVRLFLSSATKYGVWQAYSEKKNKPYKACIVIERNLFYENSVNFIFSSTTVEVANLVQ